jgi:hypothetical protein
VRELRQSSTSLAYHANRFVLAKHRNDQGRSMAVLFRVMATERIFIAACKKIGHVNGALIHNRAP